MKVKYTGETQAVKTTKGNDASIEKGKVYQCMEKEYHSGLFVRITVDSGEHVKVKRADLEKVV